MVMASNYLEGHDRYAYKNHLLINDRYYKDCYECHIEPDWLLIYKYDNNKLILILVETGSHSNLFRKF